MSATNINYNGLGMMIFRAGVGFGFGLPSDESLVGYWAFDDGSGSVAVDGSGNGNDGELINSPDWVDGVVGGCLDFVRADTEYVSIPSSTDLQITGDLTVAGWFNFDEVPVPAHTGLVSKAYGGEWLWQIYAPSKMYVWHDSGVRARWNVSGSIVAGNWYHLAFVRDGTAKTYKIYCDGVLKTTSGAYASAPPTSETHVTIGSGGSHVQPFDGLIDEVRIYSTALTASEIKALYDYPAGR